MIIVENCLFTFGKIFVVKIDAIDFRKLKFKFLKIFYFSTQESWETLKSICWLPVSLNDERTLICDHIKNPTHKLVKNIAFDCQANVK